MGPILHLLCLPTLPTPNRMMWYTWRDGAAMGVKQCDSGNWKGWRRRVGTAVIHTHTSRC
eukprot:1534388-Rhodomonas_salina.1